MFFDFNNEIKVFEIDRSFKVVEILPIRGEDFDISPYTLSDFVVTRYTQGLNLLFFYEEERKGMYSIDLGENIANLDYSSGKPSLKDWTLMYGREENTFKGARGHNLFAGAAYSLNHVGTDENFMYLMSLDTQRVSLRQGLIDSNGYAYTT